MSNLTIGMNVFLGGSGAGLVRRAFGLDGARVILQDDDVAFGPVPPIQNIEEWSAQRRAWFRSLDPDDPPGPSEEWEINEVLFSPDKFAVASHLLVWLGESLSSQLFLAFVTFAWDLLGHGDKPIFVVQFATTPGQWPIHGPGVLSSESMLSRPLPVSKLSNDEVSEYKRAWQAYCDPDPFAVSRFLSSLNGCPFLARALRELTFRYPDQSSGLGIWDQLLLTNLSSEGPRCLIPGFDGAVFSNEWREALWARFFTAAPRRQRQSVERYSIVKRA